MPRLLRGVATQEAWTNKGSLETGVKQNANACDNEQYHGTLLLTNSLLICQPLFSLVPLPRTHSCTFVVLH